MRFTCTSFALLAALAIPAAAQIDNFSIAGGGNTLTFSLPSSPTPSSTVDLLSFEIDNVAVVYNGLATTDDLGFYTALANGGFYDTFFGDPYDGVYFTGDESAPTFTPGTYEFSDTFDGPTAGTITITATPEPSSLFLFGTGTLSLAGLARRRPSRA